MKKIPNLPNLPRPLRYGLAALGVIVVAAGSGGTWLCLSDSGHLSAAKLIRYLSDDEVRITGLSGNLLENIVAEKIEIADNKGVYLTITKAQLTWQISALLREKIDIQNLSAVRIFIPRAPTSETEASDDSGPEIHLAHIAVSRIDIAKAAWGQEAHLSLRGKLHYTDDQNLGTDVSIRQIGGEGRYRIALRLKKGWPEGFARIQETGAGFAGALAGMPQLGAVKLDLDAKARGPKDAIRLTFSAGALKLSAAGETDMAAKKMRLKFHAASPAMAPRKDLSWRRLQAEGHALGSFSHPKIAAHLILSGLKSGTTGVEKTDLKLTTQDQHIRLHGAIEGLSLPGDAEKALSGAPIHLRADLDLARKDQPLQFTVTHPLMRLQGDGFLKTRRINATLSLPHLQPLAKLAGTDVSGHAKLLLSYTEDHQQTHIRLNGKLASNGTALADKLIGSAGEISARYDTSGSKRQLTAEISGAAIKARAHGTIRHGDLAGKVHLHLSHAKALSEKLSGNADFNATLSGPLKSPKLTLTGDSRIGLKDAAKEKLHLHLTADHLSGALQAKLNLSGRFSNSPLRLTADIAKTAQGIKIRVPGASWRSARLSGAVRLGNNAPKGQLQLQMQDLNDFSDLAGEKLQGALNATAQSTSSGDVRFQAVLKNLRAAGAEADNVTLTGRWQPQLIRPRLNAELQTGQIRVSGMTGHISARVNGPLDTPLGAINAHFTTPAGDIRLTTELQFNSSGSDLKLNTLQAKWNGKTIALKEPAEIRQAENGLMTRLTFSDRAQTKLSLAGQIPLKADQQFALDLKGAADLGKWSDALTAQGRTLDGQAELNFHISGTQDAPAIVGHAKLRQGKFYDVTSGVRLHHIAADVLANGDQITLRELTAKAHGGTLKGTGSLTLSGDYPLALQIHAHNARPFSRDGFKISLDGDVALKGALQGELAITGKLKLDKGEIRLPDKLPPSIATLDVRRPGTSQGVTPPAQSRIRLNMEITSPGQFFVRGHGLDAELAGIIKVYGTSARPQLHGGLEMRHGTYSMAGTSLNFTSGKIDFEGSNTSGEIDPALDFTATSETSSVTATLNITGTARVPKIALSASPEMPQDEILSQLLFQQSMDQLSPLQLAQIAQALVSLSGLDGGINPVEIARSSLKLDRLQFSTDVDSDDDSSGTSVEAGKYVLPNVYVGAKQSLSGGTRAEVQIDINRHFKVEGSVATDSGSSAVPTTQSQDTGDTVGLSYQFEY